MSIIRETGLKVYLVNDTSLNLNWGSRATTYKLRQMLTRSGATVSGSLALQQLCYLDWESRSATARFSKSLRGVAKHYPFSKLASVMLNHTARFLPEVAPPNWSEFDKLAKLLKAGRILPDVKANFLACDAVIINGEGGIFGTQRESRLMFFIAYAAKKYFNKSVAFVNHSADLRQPVLKEIAHKVYPLLDQVVFREAHSLELHAPDISGQVAADVAFDYKPAPYESWLKVASQPGYFHTFPDLWGEFDPRQPYVCVGGSSIYFRKDRPAYNPVPGFVALCQRLQEEVGQVVLTASAAADLPIFEPIAKAMGLPLIRPETSPQQAVDLLGHATAYVGGRWHGAIFAATGGTPIVTLAAHTFKVDALNEQLGLSDKPFNPLNLVQEQEGIVALVKKQLSSNSRIALRNRARELGQLSWQNVSFVREMIRERSHRAA